MQIRLLGGRPETDLESVPKEAPKMVRKAEWLAVLLTIISSQRAHSLQATQLEAI